MRPITRPGEIQKAQKKLIGQMLEESLKKTIAGQVGDVDPQRAAQITAAMVASGQLVPVGIGRNVRGLSFMPVELE
jgi:hypothetical protein